MSLHPHIHCIVPAVGYTLEAEWKEIGHSGKYLYPVHQLSDTFKGKFLDSLKRTLQKKNELALFDEITNQRIMNIENGNVTFITKDYFDKAIKKPVTLDGIEFLRRFTMHILLKRFVKIRLYGIYNHTVKRNMALHFTSEKKSSKPKEKSLPPETKQQRFERLTGFNLCLCQAYKTGRMITVRELPRIRSPGLSFLSFQNINS